MNFISPDLPEYYKQGYQSIRIALCQVHTEKWAIDDNIESALKAIDTAASQEATIAVLPECVINGYPLDEPADISDAFRERFFKSAENAGGSNLKLFREKAREKRIHVLVGFAEELNGKIHNTAGLVSPEGDYVYLYRKVHCRNFESILHHGYFTPGNEFFSSELQCGNGKINIGTMICFDREIPETLRCLRALGAAVVLCPLATDTAPAAANGRTADNELLTRAAAVFNEQFIVVVNHAGRFNGGSFVTGPMGEVVCQMNNSPGVLTVDLPAGVIPEKFHGNSFGWMGWGYRRQDVYSKYF